MRKVGFIGIIEMWCMQCNNVRYWKLFFIHYFITRYCNTTQYRVTSNLRYYRICFIFVLFHCSIIKSLQVNLFRLTRMSHSRYPDNYEFLGDFFLFSFTISDGVISMALCSPDSILLSPTIGKFFHLVDKKGNSYDSEVFAA